MKEFTLNIPIAKVDEEQRMVWGYATTEDLDSQGDIVDYDASKRAFSDWIGNIREMHQPVAVGKAIDIQFDDDDRKVMIGVKVSESADGQNAWTKVQEGILTGFSIGGKVFKTVRETIKVGDVTKAINRVVDYALSETSLVDNPACPGAQFVMVKSVDGGLQRVEKEEKLPSPVPVAWWVKSYMPTIEKAQTLYDEGMRKETAAMKKSMWDAAWLLDLAIELGYYINSEEYEGEDVADLKSALNTIKEAVVKEITEPTETLTVAVELAQKVVNLRKGKSVSKDENNTEKTNVVGGVERDHEATTVADETPKDENNVQHQDDTSADTPAAQPEAPADGAGKGGSSNEPAAKPENPKDGKKSNEVADMLKSIQTDLAKALNPQPTNDLQKSIDAIGAKVDSKFAELEERLSKVESAPVPAKSKAVFAEVKKGEEATTEELAELEKRSEHLAAHPEDAKPNEIEELTLKMRKATQATMKKED